MSQWYLNKNGKAQGPLEESQLIEMIKTGEVQSVELVYQPGASQWLPISQYPELVKHFSNASEEPILQSDEPQDWVLLQKVLSEKGKEFKQLGPFSVNQVMSLLDQGTIKFTDFAFKQGAMEAWVKISEIDVFSGPLPSSVKVDTAIYEKSQVDIEVDKTVVQKASMKDIETFQPEENESGFNAEAALEESSFHIEETQAAIPLNEESSVTSSIIRPLTDNRSEVKIWALDDHEEQGKEADKAAVSSQQEPVLDELEDLPQVADNLFCSGDQDVKPVAFNKKAIRKAGRGSRKGPFSFLSRLKKDQVQWVGVLGVLCVAVFFFYTSLNSDKGVSAQESSGNLNMVRIQPQVEPSMDSKVEAVALPEPEEGGLFSEEDVDETDVTLKPKLIKKKPVVAKKKLVRKRKLASVSSSKRNKKKAISKQVAVMKASKRKLVKTQQARALKKVSSQVGRSLQGNRKQKSFYKQRDRLALFYSSARAEALADEISQKYRRLRKNKKAWSKFYGQWKKRVRSSLAKDIRDYPKRNERYAYPKVLASFKKDYGLFYKYGARFNSKVLGRRAPAGAPAEIKSTFSRYKKKAQKLKN